MSLQLYSGCNNKLDREPYFCPSVDVKVGPQSSDQNSMGREKDFVPSLQQLFTLIRQNNATNHLP